MASQALTTTSHIEQQATHTQRHPGPGFCDLPAEVRTIIYANLFRPRHQFTVRLAAPGHEFSKDLKAMFKSNGEWEKSHPNLSGQLLRAGNHVTLRLLPFSTKHGVLPDELRTFCARPCRLRRGYNALHIQRIETCNFVQCSSPIFGTYVTTCLGEQS